VIEEFRIYQSRMRLRTIHIPEELHAQLRIKAATMRTQISQAATTAIRFWLEQKPKKNEHRKP